MSSSGTVLAVDVGGTAIKAEVVAPDGRVLARSRRPTPAGGPAVLDAIGAVGGQLLDDVDVRAAGVVVPGIVDSAAGVARYSANIGWRDLELVDPLTARWRVPVLLGHDVASAAVAELRSGSALGETHAAFVVIGTGIAAAVVSAGRLLTGPHGEMCELGHVTVRSGPRCACGGDGCLETVASARAIVTAYSERTGRDPGDAEDLLGLLDTDPDAAAVWTEAIDALADAICWLTLTTTPAVVVLGGGLAEAGDRLVQPLQDAVRARARVVPAPEIRAAALGARGGVVGAGLLARDGWVGLA